MRHRFLGDERPLALAHWAGLDSIEPRTIWTCIIGCSLSAVAFIHKLVHLYFHVMLTLKL